MFCIYGSLQNWSHNTGAGAKVFLNSTDAASLGNSVASWNLCCLSSCRTIPLFPKTVRVCSNPFLEELASAGVTSWSSWLLPPPSHSSAYKWSPLGSLLSRANTQQDYSLVKLTKIFNKHAVFLLLDNWKHTFRFCPLSLYYHVSRHSIVPNAMQALRWSGGQKSCDRCIQEK